MEAVEPSAAASVADLTSHLNGTLDRLQASLAKLGGADAPSQQFGDPAAGRALALMAAGVDSPEVVHLESAALHDHFVRLFTLFAAAGTRSTGSTSGSSSGRGPRLSSLGFRKLVRAAQLTSERCTDVDVDLIFQQVVRTRGARMSVADMLVGLAMVAKRLYPAERSQSTAFHRLLSETLLPWMLQLQVRAQCPSLAGLGRSRPGAHLRPACSRQPSLFADKRVPLPSFPCVCAACAGLGLDGITIMNE
jgi:hypothetical protein